jgi:hypothetical protein
VGCKVGLLRGVISVYGVVVCRVGLNGVLQR